jgi:hypothetical protein
MSDFESENLRIKQTIAISVGTKAGNAFEVVKTTETVIPIESTVNANVVLRGTRLEKAIIVETELSIEKPRR